MSRPIDLSGRRFGRLLVIGRDMIRPGRPHWLCRCDCGNWHAVAGFALRRGAVVSCGCARRDPEVRRAAWRTRSRQGILVDSDGGAE